MNGVEDLHGERTESEIRQSLLPGQPDAPWYRRLNWQVAGVIIALVSTIAVILFGAANLLSGHISDINENVNQGFNRMNENINHGFNRVEATIREETGEARSDILGVQEDVKDLAGEVGYLKGRLDQGQESD